MDDSVELIDLFYGVAISRDSNVATWLLSNWGGKEGGDGTVRWRIEKTRYFTLAGLT